jgi:hypothetical protein
VAGFRSQPSAVLQARRLGFSRRRREASSRAAAQGERVRGAARLATQPRVGGALYRGARGAQAAAMARRSAAGPRWATAGRAGAGGAGWVGPLARPNPVG